MPLPRAVARFNKRYTNRFIEPVVRLSSGFAVVHHVGRRSGRTFATPVNVFRDRRGHGGHGHTGDRVIVALTYGPGADWFRNAVGGGASIDFGDGARRAVETIELVGRVEAWSSLPAPVRVVLRILGVNDFAVLSVPA